MVYASCMFGDYHYDKLLRRTRCKNGHFAYKEVLDKCANGIKLKCKECGDTFWIEDPQTPMCNRKY